MKQHKVTFFVRRFPVLSQTFITEQINGLIDHGTDVDIVSMYPGDTDLATDASIARNELMARTRFLLDSRTSKTQKKSGLFSIVADAFGVAIRRPRRVPLVAFALRLVSLRKLDAAAEALCLARVEQPVGEMDLVLVHFGHIGVVAHVLRKAGILGGRQVTVFHGFEISEYRMMAHWSRFYRTLGRQTDLLLPVSRLWAQRLVALGADENRVRVHHMGVDLDRFAFSDRPLGQPLRVLSVARATEKKGLRYALEAVEKCELPIQYDLVGGGGLLPALQAQVADYAARDRIHFHGPQPHAFIMQAMQQADVFLLPSVTDSQGDMEGIPVSLMEAMASGVIVVSSNHSGIPELIEHGESGFLADERDSDALARILADLTRHPDLSRIRHNALTKIRDEFDSHQLIKELSQTLQAL